MEYATIQKITIEPNDNDNKKTRMLTVEADTRDIFHVELPVNQGCEFFPCVGDRIYYDALSETYHIVPIVSGGTDATLPNEKLKNGERESFAVSGGKRVAKITQKQDGTIALNDGVDYAVKYNELKKQFDDLAAAFNEFTGHTHTTTATAGSVTPAVINPVVAPKKYTGNLNNAKVEKVRL